MPPSGYKMKDLTFVAFQLADALRRNGWYARQTIIWSKPAAVEPGRLDRPATSHEYLFLLTKSEHYAARNPGEPWWFNTVWTIGADSVAGHQAQMPPELARRCIVAGSKPGDLVLDPFGGAGTTAMVADRLGRNATIIELNPAYAAIASNRISDDAGMFGSVTSAAATPHPPAPQSA
jgi:site-specific DNA-methyltransferase (adenine-specific)